MKLRKLKINKKGQMPEMNIFSWMVISFLVIVLFAGMIWIMGSLNTLFSQVGINVEHSPAGKLINVTKANQETFGQQAQAIQALRMVGTIYILSLGAVIIITGFLERKYPFLFFAYVLIVLLAIILAPTISNAYESLLSSGIFNGELATFTASNFLLLHLPVMVLIIGSLGGIGLFINLIRKEDGGNL